MKNTTIIIIVIIVLAAGGIFFLSKNKTTQPQTESPTSTTTETYPTTPQAGGEETTEGTDTETQAMAEEKITIEGNEFAFMPATLNLKKDQPVELTFKNTGKYPHNLIITELNVQTKTIQPGEEDIIQFTPDQTGQFTYFCGVGSHEQQGMKGTLTVQ